MLIIGLFKGLLCTKCNGQLRTWWIPNGQPRGIVWLRFLCRRSLGRTDDSMEKRKRCLRFRKVWARLGTCREHKRHGRDQWCWNWYQVPCEKPRDRRKLRGGTRLGSLQCRQLSWMRGSVSTGFEQRNLFPLTSLESINHNFKDKIIYVYYIYIVFIIYI